MILFYGEGRLGNQVFQFTALGHMALENERVLAVGLEDLQDAFVLRGMRLTVLTRSGLIKRLVKYVLMPLLLRPLARGLRMCRYAYENEEGDPPYRGLGGRLELRTGLFRGITLVDGGYYHNADYWAPAFPMRGLRVSDTLEREAREYLHSVYGPGDRPTFVHVRRGDYLNYRAYGVRDLVLPADFYRRAIREMQNRIGRTELLFITDDPPWVEATFTDIPHKTVTHSTAFRDFAIMTQCAAGIISNSTFSLAAACMSVPALIIAPRFWLGFRVRRWLPPRMELVDPRVLYLDVDTASCATDSIGGGARPVVPRSLD